MSASWGRAGGPARLVLAVLGILLFAATAHADDAMQLEPSDEGGFGRLVFDFPDRLDLPTYQAKVDNGVLAVTFDQPVAGNVPEMTDALPDYITAGRMDPDHKGIRFGLKPGVTTHMMEAGERLFIDLLPGTWQGLPPSLPQPIVDALAARAKNAAELAAQEQKAALAKKLNPQGILKVGRNPTFLRLEFDWSTDTQAQYVQSGNTATLTFDWPVAVDLYPLKAQLPPEITGAANSVSVMGSKIELKLADGVTPRFYNESSQRFTVDIDLTNAEVAQNQTTAEAAAQKAQADADAKAQAAKQAAQASAAANGGVEDAAMQSAFVPGTPITPTVDQVAGTVRVTFPFEADTASAVFRRGDTLWMLFDTPTTINQPPQSTFLSSIASGVTIIPAGDTQIVRMDLSTSKLATLASEGRSWVLSIGDVLLNATQPITLKRNRDQDGHFQMTADMGKPYKVHSFRDPLVGDVLQVVTAFAPAHGALRDLSYVDFEALHSVQGLVLRPDNDQLQVAVNASSTVISSPDGLFLSDQDAPRALDAGAAAEYRDSFIDFGALKEDNPAAFEKRSEQLAEDAADKEGAARDVARLDLATYYVANQFAEEAIGVVKVLEADLKSQELRKKVRLTEAIADVEAARPGDALAILGSDAFSGDSDAVMWRAIARSDNYDFVGARADAMVAEGVVSGYPVWVQQKFLFAAVRAALEAADVPLAQRYLKMIAFAQLSPEDVTLYQLFQGRVAEAQGQFQAALDTYGQVISADVRPTRAEAVYRTLLILRQTGKIDLAKATDTLSAEAMLWRGNPLEIDMEKLLAELYFAHKDYRLGFEIAKDAAAHAPESKPVADLTDEAEAQFSELFLNGAADQLKDVDALSLYYDFRQLTPPGAKGDEMIRNLARRLVKVDLLGQAADLLQYQIDSRLKGVAQAQVAADLALIRIADRQPEAALHALNQTRMDALPPTLDRERRILEARALIDADREDLALDLLSQVQGRDVDLLRADGYWKAKNYVAASDTIDTVYSADPTEQLTDSERLDIVRAAVGLLLANDTLGLNRLRDKFSGRMAQTPEWPMFDYITSPNASPAGMEFKAAAKAVAGMDSVSGFLASYRKLYPVDQGIAPAAPAAKSQV